MNCCCNWAVSLVLDCSSVNLVNTDMVYSPPGYSWVISNVLTVRSGRLETMTKNKCESISFHKNMTLFTAYTWMLGPILNQTHISIQLIKKCIQFLFGMARSHNIIVYTCYNKMYTSRTRSFFPSKNVIH